MQPEQEGAAKCKLVESAHALSGCTHSLDATVMNLSQSTPTELAEAEQRVKTATAKLTAAEQQVKAATAELTAANAHLDQVKEQKAPVHESLAADVNKLKEAYARLSTDVDNVAGAD